MAGDDAAQGSGDSNRAELGRVILILLKAEEIRVSEVGNHEVVSPAIVDVAELLYVALPHLVMRWKMSCESMKRPLALPRGRELMVRMMSPGSSISGSSVWRGRSGMTDGVDDVGVSGGWGSTSRLSMMGMVDWVMVAICWGQVALMCATRKLSLLAESWIDLSVWSAWIGRGLLGDRLRTDLASSHSSWTWPQRKRLRRRDTQALMEAEVGFLSGWGPSMSISMWKSSHINTWCSVSQASLLVPM